MSVTRNQGRGAGPDANLELGRSSEVRRRASAELTSHGASLRKWLSEVLATDASQEGLAQVVAPRLPVRPLVVFRTLDHEDKVRIRGRSVLVASEYPFEVVARYGDTEKTRADVGLYLLHELVHLAQGIGPKRTIGELHESGAEHLILGFDLEADHRPLCQHA